MNWLVMLAGMFAPLLVLDMIATRKKLGTWI